MEILRALGVDSTLFIHLVCFAISYFFFTKLVLNPYMAAHREREKRTIGNEQSAAALADEASKLQSEFESKAKALNGEIKKIYDESRTQSAKQYETHVQAARAAAADTLKKAQGELATEVQKARQTLSAEVPAVSAAIASKLAGKEITA